MTWTAPEVTRPEGSLIAPGAGTARRLSGLLPNDLCCTVRRADAEQLAERPSPPSNLSLLGLIRHLTKWSGSGSGCHFRGTARVADPASLAPNSDKTPTSTDRRRISPSNERFDGATAARPTAGGQPGALVQQGRSVGVQIAGEQFPLRERSASLRAGDFGCGPGHPDILHRRWLARPDRSAARKVHLTPRRTILTKRDRCWRRQPSLVTVLDRS